MASADTSPEPVSQNQVVNSVFHPPEFTAQAEPGPQGAILRGPQVVSCVRNRIKRSWSDSGAWGLSAGWRRAPGRRSIYSPAIRACFDAVKKPKPLVNLAQVQTKRKPGFNHCREDRPGRIFSGISLPSPNSGVSYLRKCTARTSQNRPGRFNGPGRWVCTSSSVKIAPGANSDRFLRVVRQPDIHIAAGQDGHRDPACPGRSEGTPELASRAAAGQTHETFGGRRLPTTHCHCGGLVRKNFLYVFRVWRPGSQTDAVQVTGPTG